MRYVMSYTVVIETYKATTTVKLYYKKNNYIENVRYYFENFSR